MYERIKIDNGIEKQEQKIDINDILKYKVDINQQVPKPEIILSICDVDGNNKRMVMTRQNISCVTAQAKVGKSFLVKLIISSCLKKGIFQNRLHSEMPNGKDKILYIDTEQSLYHVQLGLKQVRDLVNEVCSFDKVANNLDVFQFDAVGTETRIEYVKELIYSKKYSFVILDGISDLSLDTNDLRMADKLVTDLRIWATENDLHILNVIHLNPGDLSHKMKGHLGTKLADKSETVLGISVDKENENNRIVQSLASRNRKSDPFIFEITENGVPNITENEDIYSKIQSTKRPNKAKLLKDKQTDILCDAFLNSDTSGIAYGELLDKIKRAYIKITNDTIGDNLAKKFIQECKETSVILINTENKKYIYATI
jgi:hypothetical protein